MMKNLLKFGLWLIAIVVLPSVFTSIGALFFSYIAGESFLSYSRTDGFAVIWGITAIVTAIVGVYCLWDTTNDTGTPEMLEKEIQMEKKRQELNAVCRETPKFSM